MKSTRRINKGSLLCANLDKISNHPGYLVLDPPLRATSHWDLIFCSLIINRSLIFLIWKNIEESIVNIWIQIHISKDDRKKEKSDFNNNILIRVQKYTQRRRHNEATRAYYGEAEGATAPPLPWNVRKVTVLNENRTDSEITERLHKEKKVDSPSRKIRLPIGLAEKLVIISLEFFFFFLPHVDFTK